VTFGPALGYLSAGNMKHDKSSDAAGSSGPLQVGQADDQTGFFTPVWDGTSPEANPAAEARRPKIPMPEGAGRRRDPKAGGLSPSERWNFLDPLVDVEVGDPESNVAAPTLAPTAVVAPKPVPEPALVEPTVPWAAQSAAPDTSHAVSVSPDRVPESMPEDRPSSRDSQAEFNLRAVARATVDDTPAQGASLLRQLRRTIERSAKVLTERL
jgi:hypothetical protein